MRIVSLIPSATEIACRLGLREALVGVTHECDFPAGVDALPTVTRSVIPIDTATAEIDRLVTEQTASEPSLDALDAKLVQLAGGNEALEQPAEKSPRVLGEGVAETDPYAIAVACYGLSEWTASESISNDSRVNGGGRDCGSYNRVEC